MTHDDPRAHDAPSYIPLLDDPVDYDSDHTGAAASYVYSDPSTAQGAPPAAPGTWQPTEAPQQRWTGTGAGTGAAPDRLDRSAVHSRLTGRSAGAQPGPHTPASAAPGPAGGPARADAGAPWDRREPAPRPRPVDGQQVEPTPPSNPANPASAVGELDWGLVRALRASAADLLSRALATEGATETGDRERIGQRIVVELIADHYRNADQRGQSAAYDTAGVRQQLTQALLDSLFGMGRLQPLVDNEELENIEIYGCDNVWLIYGDGRIVRGPAIADSDEELISEIQFLASRGAGREQGAERPFSPANATLNLKLPGGHRLAASAWITPRPQVVIRRHRLVEIDLDDLVQSGMLDATAASLLRAAVRARRSIVVSGPQGSGKTTMLRALCNEMEALEPVGTLETEYELLLHEMRTSDGKPRHPRCSAWEARPGSGERGADGSKVGEVTLSELLEFSLRNNRSRLIVGEVRGAEIITMFNAMQSGAGSLSTTHANSARGVVDRLVTCAMAAGPQISEAWAYRQVADHIDFVVQIRLEDSFDMEGDQGAPSGGGRRERWVSEIVAIEPGDGGRPALTEVYKPDPVTGRGVPNLLPDSGADSFAGLQHFGFDVETFRAQAQQQRGAQA